MRNVEMHAEAAFIRVEMRRDAFTQAHSMQRIP